jgi:hypothetical protein
MKEETKKKILAVAQELAEKYGFWSFKVEEILQYAS